MNRSIIVSALVFLTACARPAPEAAPAPTVPAVQAAPAPAAPTEAARQAAREWLRLVDGGEYRRSWEEAGQIFRQQLTADQWAQALQQARAPQGAVSARELQHAQPTRQLPGAPEGEYVVLVFDTVFAAGPMREQVVLVRENDGPWRVIGYFVQP